MRDPFANYDSWLEAPYQQMMAESDAYYDWCEANDLDPEAPESEQLYEDSWAADYDFDYEDEWEEAEAWDDAD